MATGTTDDFWSNRELLWCHGETWMDSMEVRSNNTKWVPKMI